MPKKFSSQLILLIALNVVIKLVWMFGVERVIQLKVGFAEYGIYFSLFNFTYILSVINDPGLSNLMIKSIAGKQTDEVIGSFFYIKILFSVIYFLVTFCLARWMEYPSAELLILLLCYHILWGLLVYFRSIFKAHQKGNSEILFSVFDKILLISAVLPIFLWMENFEWRIHYYVFIQIITLIISNLICVFFLLRDHISIGLKPFTLPSMQVFKQLIPFAFFGLLVLAYNKIDAVLLAKLLPGNELELGTYAAAYRFLDASNMLPLLFVSLFYPLVTKQLAHRADITDLLTKSLKSLLTVSITLSIVCWFYKRQIMELFYHTSSNESLIFVFGILMCCMPLVVCYYLYSTILTAMGKLKVLNIISALGLITNIALNWWWIPIYGIKGAAFASFISLFIIALLYIMYYYAHLKNTFNPKFWLSLILYASILFAGIYFLVYTPFRWFIQLIIVLPMATILAMLLHLLPKNLSQIFLMNKG